MKTTKTITYFFATLVDCESRILRLGTPLNCRVIVSSRAGREDTYHIGTEKTDNFVITKSPLFSEMVPASKDQITSGKWRQSLSKLTN